MLSSSTNIKYSITSITAKYRFYDAKLSKYNISYVWQFTKKLVLPSFQEDDSFLGWHEIYAILVCISSGDSKIREMEYNRDKVISNFNNESSWLDKT